MSHVRQPSGDSDRVHLSYSNSSSESGLSLLQHLPPQVGGPTNQVQFLPFSTPSAPNVPYQQQFLPQNAPHWQQGYSSFAGPPLIPPQFTQYQAPLPQTVLINGQLYYLAMPAPAAAPQPLPTLLPTRSIPVIAAPNAPFPLDRGVIQQIPVAPLPKVQVTTTPNVEIFAPAAKTEDATCNGTDESSTLLLNKEMLCRHFMEGRCNRRKCRFVHPKSDTLSA